MGRILLSPEPRGQKEEDDQGDPAGQESHGPAETPHEKHVFAAGSGKARPQLAVAQGPAEDEEVAAEPSGQQGPAGSPTPLG